VSEPLPEIPLLRTGPAPATSQPPTTLSPPPAAAQAAPARELFVRHARKDGRSVAILKAVDYGDSCVVEADVFPQGAVTGAPVRPGPYTFADTAQATAFVTQAVEALMLLGCDVHAE
jgi:hypothetical protein